MEEALIKIMDIINNMPPFWGYLTLISCIIVYALYKSNIMNKLLNKQKILKKQISDLQHHNFFNICMNINRKVISLNFRTFGEYDSTKTKLMHILISNKLETVISEFRKFITDTDIEKITNDELKSSVKLLLFNLVDKYSNKTFNDYVKLGISVEDANFFIKSYEEYRSDIVEGFTDISSDILSNDDYDTSYEKLSAIFELCSLSIWVIPRDIQSVFENINGKYKKYEL